MTKEYKAAMIVIGDEVLSGRTQDANVNYAARKLVGCGVKLTEVRIIGDDEQTIIDTVRDLKTKVDYIFTSGGIGPTHDDITAASVAKAFGVELKENPDARASLQAYYDSRGHELTESRLQMAQIPVGAELILNPVSGAPGFILEGVHVMAGIPKIMHAMMDHVCETLEGGAVVLSRTIPCDYPESEVSRKLGEIHSQCPDVEIGSYPQQKPDGGFRTDFVLRSTDEAALDHAAGLIDDMLTDMKRQNAPEP